MEENDDDYDLLFKIVLIGNKNIFAVLFKLSQETQVLASLIYYQDLQKINFVIKLHLLSESNSQPNK